DDAGTFHRRPTMRIETRYNGPAGSGNGGWSAGTEDEWQVAAEAGLLVRREPLVWNLTESEHSDGRTRFAILKGGAQYRAQGSDWYLDGGPQPADVSVKLLLTGAGLARSEQVGFRCAADLPEVTR
ncbi:hypothetical protein ABZ749_30275, partial [Micromonospora sp. NPDC047753]